MPQQDSFGGHGNPREFGALVARGFGDQENRGLSQPGRKIGQKLTCSYLRGVRAAVMVDIPIEPRIEDVRQRGKGAQKIEELHMRAGGPSLPRGGPLLSGMTTSGLASIEQRILILSSSNYWRDTRRLQRR